MAKIETKYDVRQIVWVHWMGHGDEAVVLPMKIVGIGMNDMTPLYYQLFSERIGKMYALECDLYPTKQAAEQAMKEGEK